MHPGFSCCEIDWGSGRRRKRKFSLEVLGRSHGAKSYTMDSDCCLVTISDSLPHSTYSGRFDPARRPLAPTLTLETKVLESKKVELKMGPGSVCLSEGELSIEQRVE